MFESSYSAGRFRGEASLCRFVAVCSFLLSDAPGLEISSGCENWDSELAASWTSLALPTSPRDEAGYVSGLEIVCLENMKSAALRCLFPGSS